MLLESTYKLLLMIEFLLIIMISQVLEKESSQNSGLLLLKKHLLSCMEVIKN